jgi:hypothetical protein
MEDLMGLSETVELILQNNLSTSLLLLNEERHMVNTREVKRGPHRDREQKEKREGQTTSKTVVHPSLRCTDVLSVYLRAALEVEVQIFGPYKSGLPVQELHGKLSGYLRADLEWRCRFLVLENLDLQLKRFTKFKFWTSSSRAARR